MAKINAEVAKNPKTTTAMSLAMPSSFVQSLETPDITATSSFASPYVTFPSAAGKQWKNLALKLPGLKEYDPCLVYPNGNAIKLDQLKFCLHSGYQFWAFENASGDILKVKFEEDRAWKEYHDVVILVFLKDSVELARCSFKTTKTPAIKKAWRVLEEAKDDVEWAKKSVAHDQTVKLNLPPHLRFFNVVELTPRVSKSSGMNYVQADSQDYPTTASEWQLLGELFKREDFEKIMKDIESDVIYRKKNLNTKV